MSHAVAVTPPHAYEWAWACARWKLACASMIPCRSHFLAELRIADHHDALHAPRPTPHTSTATTATPHGCHLYHPVSPTSYCYHKYPSHTITTTLPPPMPPHTIITTLPHYHHAMPTDHQHRHTTTTRYPSHTITTTLPPPDTHKYLRMAHPQRHVVLHQLCAVHVRTGTALVLARASKGLCIVVAKDRRVGNAPPAMHRACTKARPWVGMCERWEGGGTCAHARTHIHIHTVVAAPTSG